MPSIDTPRSPCPSAAVVISLTRVPATRLRIPTMTVTDPSRSSTVLNSTSFPSSVSRLPRLSRRSFAVLPESPASIFAICSLRAAIFRAIVLTWSAMSAISSLISPIVSRRSFSICFAVETRDSASDRRTVRWAVSSASEASDSQESKKA